MRMRQLIIFLAFSFSVFFTNAQKNHPVYVSSWVNKPEQEGFSKPLIFIDFWATWCGPCISSMTHTEVLADEFRNDVLFLYISDEPSGKVKNFMTKRNKTFFAAVDNSGNNISNFNIVSIPNKQFLKSIRC